MPHAEFRLLAAELRVFGNGTHGDPYNYGLLIVGTDKPDVAEIRLLSGRAPTPDECRVIRDELHRVGIRKVVWSRDGGTLTHGAL